MSLMVGDAIVLDHWSVKSFVHLKSFSPSMIMNNGPKVHQGHRRDMRIRLYCLSDQFLYCRPKGTYLLHLHTFLQILMSVLQNRAKMEENAKTLLMRTYVNVPRVMLVRTAKQVRKSTHKIFDTNSAQTVREVFSDLFWASIFAEVKECDSQPCENGAKCVEGNDETVKRMLNIQSFNDEESSYSCICVPGYTGRNCEKGN